MLSAMTQKKEKVFAERVERNNNYFCPLCGIQMVLKKGEIKIAHFAHKILTDCQYEGESQEHYAMKNIVEYRYNNFFPNGFIEKEYLIQKNNIKRIIDLVCLDKSNNKIAIEVQYSPISLELFLERTRNLILLDYKVIWIFNIKSYFKIIKSYKNNFYQIRINNLFYELITNNYPIFFLDTTYKLFYILKFKNFKWLKRVDGSCTTKGFANREYLNIYKLFDYKLQLNNGFFSKLFWNYVSPGSGKYCNK